jgi:hypothetical protein
MEPGFPALLQTAHGDSGWQMSDFQPTHIGGSWASLEYWRPAMEKIRHALHRDLNSVIRDDRFVYKPVGFRSEISDLFVYIEDRDGPEWWAQVSFDFFIQGDMRNGFLKEAFKLTAIAPTYRWWDNFNGQAGCTFEPGSFHIARFSWHIQEADLAARGFPTRNLYQVWKENNWSTSSYWSRQVRPTSSLVRQAV